MQTLHQRRRETFLRLKDFAATHPDIPATTVWPHLVTELDTVISDLGSHIADEAAHDGAASQGTDLRSSAREALRESMERIARTARALNEGHPGFNAQFRMPVGNNDEDLIGAALGMANAASPADVKARFLSHAMPADFIADLEGDIAEFQTKITKQFGSVGDRKSSRVLINQKVEYGMSIKRQMDSVVRNHYHDRPEVLAEWETASHVERGARRKKAPVEVPEKEESPRKGEPK